MANRQFHPSRTEPPADKWLDRLVGTDGHSDLPSGISREGAGGKFSPEGKVFPFPGNTFICHIDKTSEAYETLCAMQDQVKAFPAADCFTFLPHESFHMTVFCGLSGDPLDSDGWPDDVPRGRSLAEMNRHFLEKVSTLEDFSGVTVRADHLKAGYSIHAEPADQVSFDALWAMRDALRDATGLRRMDHDSYQFHISFGYRLKRMPHDVAEDHIRRVEALFDDHRDALREIRLGPVEFCTFENMHHFEPLAFIGPEGPVRVSA